MADIRVAIIEHSKKICEYYADILSQNHDITVTGYNTTGYDGILDAVFEKPGVLLTGEDVDGPGTGIALARALLRRLPHIKIILLVDSPNQQTFVQASRAGIVDYLLKNDDRDIILKTVLEAGRLSHPGQQDISEKFYARTVHPEGVHDSLMYTLTVVSQLTPKEIVITKLIAEGLSCSEIAAKRHTTVGDIEEQTARILEKFKKNSVEELSRMLRILNIMELFVHAL